MTPSQPLELQRVRGCARWTGWRVAGPDVAVHPTGRTRWVLHPPTTRAWTSTGCLASTEPQPWRLRHADDGVLLETPADGAETDVVELSAEQSAERQADRSPAMTVLGAFAPLAGPATLGDFLVGGEVLDTNVMAGRRCPSEQTALSVYRIARSRGGAFWEAVAGYLAEWTRRRLEGAPDRLPVHDLWGSGETHTRFLADAVLLLLAEAERDSTGPWQAAARRGLDGLERLRVDWLGGTWTLHDTLELGREHDGVLNTHVQVMLVRLAAGLPVDGDARALDAALRLTAEPRRAQALAVGTWVTMLGEAWAPAAADPLVSRLAHAVEAVGRRSRQRRPHLRLPGGWIERHLPPQRVAPYFAVNLADLAALQRNAATPTTDRALRSALRFARSSGYFRWLGRTGSALRVLEPQILANAGHPGAARRAARRLGVRGVAPLPGWPGHTDHLWARLTEGTP